jgi:Tol biopolymer transport system component
MGMSFTLSPDGRRIARGNPLGPNRNLWIDDLERGTTSRFTFGDNDSFPQWSPDGKRVVYSSGLPKHNIFWKSVDDGGAGERLSTSDQDQFPHSFTPDGKLLVYVDYDPASGADIWILPLEGDRKPRPFLRTPFSENYPQISPDGKWIAYESNESGRFEVFVQPFPSGGRKWQASTDGGKSAHWSRDGRSLFYRNRNAMMTASWQPENETVAKPKIVFQGDYEPIYAVRPGGGFVMMQLIQDSAHTQMNLVTNWREELARRVN